MVLQKLITFKIGIRWRPLFTLSGVLIFSMTTKSTSPWPDYEGNSLISHKWEKLFSIWLLVRGYLQWSIRSSVSIDDFITNLGCILTEVKWFESAWYSIIAHTTSSTVAMDYTFLGRDEHRWCRFNHLSMEGLFDKHSIEQFPVSTGGAQWLQCMNKCRRTNSNRLLGIRCHNYSVGHHGGETNSDEAENCQTGVVALVRTFIRDCHTVKKIR